jgi:hypothetical protein
MATDSSRPIAHGRCRELTAKKPLFDDGLARLMPALLLWRASRFQMLHEKLLYRLAELEVVFLVPKIVPFVVLHHVLHVDRAETWSTISLKLRPR